MNLSFFKSEPKLAFPRCEHRSPSGRQCSQPVCTSDPRFCGTHKPTPQQIATVELTEAAGTLSSPEEVQSLLKTVTLLRIRGLITPKDANTSTAPSAKSPFTSNSAKNAKSATALPKKSADTFPAKVIGTFPAAFVP